MFFEDGGVALIKLEITRIFLLPKEQKLGDNDDFIIAYEYCWYKRMNTADASQYMLQQTKYNSILDALPSAFSATILFSYQPTGSINYVDA